MKKHMRNPHQIFSEKPLANKYLNTQTEQVMNSDEKLLNLEKPGKKYK